MEKIKLILFRIVIISLPIFISLIIFEVGLRIFRPARSTPSMGKPDKIFHHGFKPNAYRYDKGKEFEMEIKINSFGFRDKERVVAKSTATYRILLLGDSFVFGSGVNEEDRFDNILGQILNEKYQTKAGKRFEIINMGVGSYSPILEYLTLREKGLRFSPDLVMLFYDFSDLKEDYNYSKNAIFDKSGNLIACNPFFVNGHPDYISSLRDKSYAFSYFYRKLEAFFKKVRIIGLKNYIACKIRGKRVKEFIRESKHLKSIEFDHYLMMRPGMSDVVRQYWKKSEFYLNKIKNLCDKNNIEFILVSYPYGVHVSPTAWNKGRVLHHFEQNKLYASEEVFAPFYEYSKRFNVKYINLWPYLLKYNHEKIYYDADPHWTALGNKRVAQSLAEDSIFKKTILQN